MSILGLASDVDLDDGGSLFRSGNASPDPPIMFVSFGTKEDTFNSWSKCLGNMSGSPATGMLYIPAASDVDYIFFRHLWPTQMVPANTLRKGQDTGRVSAQITILRC